MFSTTKMESIIGKKLINDYFLKYKNHSNAKIEEFEPDIFLINEKSGIDFSFDANKELKAIFIYGYENDDYEMFKDKLPFDFDFDLGKKKVRNLYGSPYKIKPAIPALGVNSGDIFDYGDFYLSVEYTLDSEKLSNLKIYLKD